MTRLGVSPTRGKPSNYQPAQVTAAVLTFIPEMEGYYRHRLDVLRVCLESLLHNTEGDFDLLVFDNGSCPEVVDYLRGLNQAGKIDILMLSSRNIGQIGALKAVFSAAPGEYIAYSDDDVLFYPGWLQASLEIFETFPKAGFVSAIPLRGALDKTSKPNEAFGASNLPGLQIGADQWIPDSYEIEHDISTGNRHSLPVEGNEEHQDPYFELDGVRVLPTAIHFQYMGPRQVLLNALPVDRLDRLMAPMAELEAGIDEQGYLRLSTATRFVKHIGNVVSSEMAAEAKQMGIDVAGIDVSRRPRRHWLLEIPRMRPLLEKIYGKLYDILHHVQY